MRQASVASSIASMNNAGGAAGATIDNGGGGTVRLGTENGVDEIGGHFMQPLTAMDFMQASDRRKTYCMYCVALTLIVLGLQSPGTR